MFKINGLWISVVGDLGLGFSMSGIWMLGILGVGLLFLSLALFPQPLFFQPLGLQPYGLPPLPPAKNFQPLQGGAASKKCNTPSEEKSRSA